MKTSAIFFPFDLFGGGGTRQGVELLADELLEILDDNRREKVATRAAAYTNKIQIKQFSFETLESYQNWRQTGRQAVRQALRKGDFLLWISGNHLGTLPVYDELAAAAEPTLVVQFDAHLDIHHFADCTRELSHGNFLLHCAGQLPPLVNLGHRDLLLPRDYVARFYRDTFPVTRLALDGRSCLEEVSAVCDRTSRVFLDIDCDVLDPAFFPAVSQPVPFGLSPQQLLLFLEAVWSEKVIGMSLSEFDPARDRDDESLALVVWLLEYLLLRRYEI